MKPSKLEMGPTIKTCLQHVHRMLHVKLNQVVLRPPCLRGQHFGVNTIDPAMFRLSCAQSFYLCLSTVDMPTRNNTANYDGEHMACLVHHAIKTRVEHHSRYINLHHTNHTN